MKKGWRGGAGSNFDAWLTTAAAQVTLMPVCQQPFNLCKSTELVTVQVVAVTKWQAALTAA